MREKDVYLFLPIQAVSLIAKVLCPVKLALNSVFAGTVLLNFLCPAYAQA